MLDERVKERGANGAAWWRPLTWAIIAVNALLLFVILSPVWPASILDKADIVGSAVCGRISDHSLHLAGRQLPLCARCTGTFTGALLGFVGLLALGKGRAARMPPARVLGVLVGFIVLMAIDGLNSYLSVIVNRPLLYQPHNLLRLVTGTLHGLALSIIVFPIFNFTLWKEPDQRPALAGLRDLGLLILVLVLPFVVIAQAEPDWLLYPLSIVSVLGVLVMLTVVNSMIITIAIRREAEAVAWWQAALPIAVGFTATLLEIAVIVVLRWQFVTMLGIPAL